MNKFIPYGIKIANTKTKERVIIELEFGGAEQLYKYLAPIVHEWAVNKEIEPVKSTPNLSGLSDFGGVLKNTEERLSQIEGQLADVRAVILHKD